MSTRTFSVDRDARVGTGGGLNLGAGACDHLPVGEAGGYHYRSFIKFDNDWSGMTDVSSVMLYLTNDDDSLSDDHLVRGSTSGARKFYVDRVTEGWGAGTSSHPMSTSNGSISSGGNMVYPGPTCSITGDNRVGPFTSTDVDNDQQSFNVTDVFKTIGPTTVYFSGASTPGYGGGNINYGIRLIREDSGDTLEFWSSEKGGSTKVPKIVVTYTSNTLPTIVIDSPSDGTVVTGGTTYATPSVTIGATATDADGDAITNVQFEFDTTADFATPYLTSTADDDTAGVVSRAVSSATHPRGTEIFVRARASDATGYGGWSPTASFTINDATSPVITGTAATAMEMTVEGADTTAKAVVRFTYADPEGQSISRYVCKLQDSTGVTTYETIDISTTTAPAYVKFTYSSLVHGTTYKFSVETYDADGLSAGATTQNRVARWAVREEYVALTTATWVATTVKVEATDTRAVIQHGIQTAGAAGTNPTNYNTDPSALSSLTPTYYWVKFWLFAWNGAAIAGVSVTSHSLTYTSTSLAADGWTLGTGATITTARSWYGTRCLRIDGNGTTRSASVSVTGFKVGETYTISCRIFQSGAANGFLRLMSGSTSLKSAGLVDVGVSNASTSEFVYTWDTLTNCPAETLTIQCDMDGAASTYVLFDAIKVEQGTVATPWTPSVLGRAVVVDGNGVQIDGRGGGVVRFRGTDTASTEAEVDLIDRGLRFTSPLTLKEISSPSNPAANYRRLFLKSDGNLYFRNSAGTETVIGPGNDHAGLTNLTTGDPHTQYQQESEKDAASGYVGLDASSNAAVAGYLGVLGVRFQVAVSSAASVKTTNTFGDITGLTLPVVNGREYAWEAWGLYETAGTTTGLSIGFNHPGGVCTSFIDIYSAATSGTTPTTEFNVATDTNTGTTTITTANAPRHFRMRGTYQCTADGTFALRYKRNGTSTNVTIHKGSILTMYSVA